MLKRAVNKPRRRGRVFIYFFYSQHSGARRADEAAHRDVGVSHSGLVALEAVFVYSGLGQLTDLAGADLLVVPVLSVRHFIPSRFLARRLGVKPVTLRCPPPESLSVYYMEHFTAALWKRFYAASPLKMRDYAEERRVKSRTVSCTHAGSIRDLLQSKSK